MYQKEKKLARIRRRIDQVMEAKSVTPLEGTKDSERQAERNAGSINPPDAGQKEHQKGIRAEELQVYEAFFKSSKFLTCSEYLGQWRLGGDSIKDIFYIPDFIDEDTEQFILNQTYAVPDSSWVQLRERRLQCFGGQPNLGGSSAQAFCPEPLPDWLKILSDSLVAPETASETINDKDKAGNADNIPGSPDAVDKEAGCSSEEKQNTGSKDYIFMPEQTPNHVLLNEYEPGQGILPHTDGPQYYPRVAILSLGSPCLMRFRPRLAPAKVGAAAADGGEGEGGGGFEVALAPRSLLVFSGVVYSSFLHGIDCTDNEVVGTTCLNCKGSSSQDISCSSTASSGAIWSSGDIIERGTRVSLTIRHIPCHHT